MDNRLGKIIVFAKNHLQAGFIQARFDANLSNRRAVQADNVAGRHRGPVEKPCARACAGWSTRSSGAAAR